MSIDIDKYVWSICGRISKEFPNTTTHNHFFTWWDENAVDAAVALYAGAYARTSLSNMLNRLSAIADDKTLADHIAFPSNMELYGNNVEGFTYNMLKEVYEKAVRELLQVKYPGIGIFRWEGEILPIFSNQYQLWFENGLDFSFIPGIKRSSGYAVATTNTGYVVSLGRDAALVIDGVMTENFPTYLAHVANPDALVLKAHRFSLPVNRYAAHLRDKIIELVDSEVLIPLDPEVYQKQLNSLPVGRRKL